MAYATTDIAQVTAPAAPAVPILNNHETPNVDVVKPAINTANTGYTAPTTTTKTNNLNAGLLEYDGTAAKAQPFDGRQIATPEAATINATPDFKTSNNYLTDGAFVENRVNNLLSEDSQSMQRVKAQGMAEAGARGLQNTTMGATIGQTAMIDKALRQNVTYQAQRANQDATNTSSLASQAAKINSALAEQTAGNSWDSTIQKGVVQGELNKQTGNIAGATATQAAQYAADARTQT
ncbi:MAG: hypothetical protein JZU65_16145, partial [Chlorobium sp.]|nr:hypothetical protein [Chlorobium sp.]